ncbi:MULTISPECIES: hypothetical protein [unclassified Mesorhizobium]|uniref:hypothetical protein n=1 Tax=unclassified Mesorhizobium TaxID=325217 RepID=UPI0015E36170|nr:MULTISPECIES: hypothetical protein [unclassified Mesorhizobium]
MGADYTVGGLFVNWPILSNPRMRPTAPFDFVAALPLCGAENLSRQAAHDAWRV